MKVEQKVRNVTADLTKLEDHYELILALKKKKSKRLKFVWAACIVILIR